VRSSSETAADARGRSAPSPARLGVSTAAVLVCFAANQLLSRAALGPVHADPIAFTSARLVSGALALAVLVRHRGARIGGGSWPAALALFGYAVAYSLAYVRIGAGIGSLVQFAAVQATMMGWIVARGARPRPAQWLGLGVALLGVAGLSAPGAHAPDPAGTILMIAAGVAWGAYSLGGHGARGALATTAANFARTVPLTVALSLVAALAAPPRLGAAGLALALASGAVASGGGYALWYAVIPALGTARAAVVQLAVPVVAAAGGALLLGERITPRVVLSAAAILSGIAASVRPEPRAAPGPGS
jgi:drug/metabolite transporter (DMT)-like permease